MARKTIGANADDEIAVTLSRTEALALARVADTGLRVSRELGLIQSPASAERAIAKLNAAASRAG